jgi:electron transfer flavoprotein alpha subunit
MSNSQEEVRRVLVIVEEDNGEIAAITFELLHVGKDLADRIGASLCAVLVGHDVARGAENVAACCDEVYCVKNPCLTTFRSDLYLLALEDLLTRFPVEIILMGHTINNIDLAPRLAHRMGASLITDCTSVIIDEETGSLLCTKPVYGDRANAVFVADGKPKMVTLRSKSVEPIQQRIGAGKIFNLDVTPDQSMLDRIELIEAVAGESVSLDKADAIVAGGRGIKGREGLKVLERLIEALRNYFGTVEMGGSRPLIDEGLLPKSRQLGQTGEKAAPRLYVAVAISGSSQHIGGIVRSRKIIAINKDVEAPIFGVADYGVVGQYEDVVPALVEKLRELA